MQQLKKDALKAGLRVVDNAGQGDCQFEALAQLLCFHDICSLDYATVRSQVVEYLRTHPDTVS